MAANIEGKCKRLSYVHFHSTRFPEAQSRLTRSDANFCWDRPGLAADPPGLRGRLLLAGGRGLGLALARSLFWRYALCLGQPDRPDPALSDGRLLRRRTARGPLSGTQGVLSADGGRGPLYYAHSADCTASSLLDTGCVRGEFAGRFLWLADLGNLGLCRSLFRAGGLDLGLAPARPLLRHVALYLGQRDRSDPALSDDRLLRRWTLRGPPSTRFGALYADDHRGLSDRPHSLDLAPDPLLVAEFVLYVLDRRFLWFAARGDPAVRHPGNSAELRLALCDSPPG